MNKKIILTISILLFFTIVSVVCITAVSGSFSRGNVSEASELEVTDIPEEPIPEEEIPAPEPPRFIMLCDRVYKTGTDLSLMDLVYAEDAEGNDITDRIEIVSDGGYNPDSRGVYQITYSVSDEEGVTAEETINVSIGDYDKNEYGFAVDSEIIGFLIEHGYFGYDTLSEDEAGDIAALTALTSPTSFGAAYGDGACTCFLYKVTENYLFFFTNKHCPVDSADTLCIYDYNDNMTEIPDTDITFLKYHPEYDAVANGYLQYDQQMFVVPISYFNVDELLTFREVHVDTSAYEQLKAGDYFLMNTQSWRRCQQDIVLDNTVMFVDCYEQTAYHYDEDPEKLVPAVSHMVVGDLKNAVGSCSGSPCFDKYGNFLGFIWGTTYAIAPEITYLDQFVPLPYFLEFADSVDYYETN